REPGGLRADAWSPDHASGRGGDAPDPDQSKGQARAARAAAHAGDRELSATAVGCIRRPLRRPDAVADGPSLPLGILHRGGVAAVGQRRTDGDGRVRSALWSPARTDGTAADLERTAAATRRRSPRVHEEAERPVAGGDGSALRAVPAAGAPVLPAVLAARLAQDDPSRRRTRARRHERRSPAVCAFAGATLVLDVAVRLLRTRGEGEAVAGTWSRAGQFQPTGCRRRSRAGRDRCGALGGRLPAPLLLERPQSRRGSGGFPVEGERLAGDSRAAADAAAAASRSQRLRRRAGVLPPPRRLEGDAQLLH